MDDKNYSVTNCFKVEDILKQLVFIELKRKHGKVQKC
jgi:hypothetical protein